MISPNFSNQFLTPPAVARLLKTSVEQVHGWIASGELKAVNLSRGHRPRWKIEPSELRTFLDGKSNRSGTLEAKRVRQIPQPRKDWLNQ